MSDGKGEGEMAGGAGVGGGGGPIGGGPGGQPGGGEPDQPMSDELRWRARAVRAEEALRELEEKLRIVEADLKKTREALDAVERRRVIERELADADAVDIETAVLMTEAAVGQMKEADVKAAVRELTKRKPFLFRPRRRASSSSSGGAGVSAMSGVPRGSEGRSVEMELIDVARQARSSGDRRALLRYLRARRGG